MNTILDSSAIWSFMGSIIVSIITLIGNYGIQKAQSEKDNALQNERIAVVQKDVGELKEKVENLAVGLNDYGTRIARAEEQIATLKEQISMLMRKVQ